MIKKIAKKKSFYLYTEHVEFLKTPCFPVKRVEWQNYSLMTL